MLRNFGKAPITQVKQVGIQHHLYNTKNNHITPATVLLRKYSNPPTTRVKQVGLKHHLYNAKKTSSLTNHYFAKELL